MSPVGGYFKLEDSFCHLFVVYSFPYSFIEYFWHIPYFMDLILFLLWSFHIGEVSQQPGFFFLLNYYITNIFFFFTDRPVLGIFLLFYSVYCFLSEK